MSTGRQYNGSAGSPIKLQNNRQTEESARYRQPRKPRVADDGVENPDAWEEAKPHTSAIRYDKPVPPRRTATQKNDPYKTALMKNRRSFDKWTLITWLCLAIIVMAGGWFVFSKIADWWTGVTDDWKYGNPRTYQTDQFVGQGDSPDHPDHFIVVNTHGQVIVIQINPQHPNLDHIYGITTTDPKVPVSLSFRPTGTTWAMYVIIGD